MKKIIIFTFFVIIVVQNIYAKNEENLEKLDLTLQISVRYIFPSINKPEWTSFIDYGAGLNYEIIPKIFSPGVYFDIGLGTDWFFLFSKDKYPDNKLDQIGLNIGFRINNLMEFGIVFVNTFMGYNINFGQTDIRVSSKIHNPILGISINIYFFNIEYSYYIPTKYSDNTSFNHLSIGFIISGRIVDKFNK